MEIGYLGKRDWLCEAAEYKEEVGKGQEGSGKEGGERVGKEEVVWRKGGKEKNARQQSPG